MLRLHCKLFSSDHTLNIKVQRPKVGFSTIKKQYEISSSHGCEYEAQNLLGCTVGRHPIKNMAVYPRRFRASKGKITF
jgi:hypothetical protein